jgi:DNA-directed RNA polymerase specialized sigma24 family protein
VASRMGRSVDSVEKLWVRALGKLRQVMADHSAGESGASP